MSSHGERNRGRRREIETNKTQKKGTRLSYSQSRRKEKQNYKKEAQPQKSKGQMSKTNEMTGERERGQTQASVRANMVWGVCGRGKSGG